MFSRYEVRKAVETQAQRALEAAVYQVSHDSQDPQDVEIELDDDGMAAYGLDLENTLHVIETTDEDLSCYSVDVESIRTDAEGIASSIICREGESIARELWESFTEFLEDENLEGLPIHGEDPLSYFPPSSVDDHEYGTISTYRVEGTKVDVWEFAFESDSGEPLQRAFIVRR